MERLWTDHFRRTGTYHMLVIDGLHITVLAAFLLVPPAALLSPRDHRARDHRLRRLALRAGFRLECARPSAPPGDSRCMLPRATSIAGAGS